MANQSQQETESLSLIPIWGWFVIGFALVNLMVLHASPVPLSPRELTYWAWGQDFALNYDGHGPLLAWLIGASTFVLGDTEFAVRIWGPLWLMVGAFFSVAASGILFDRTTAAKIAPFVVLTPVISLGSLEASIAPLTFCTAAVLSWAVVRYLRAPRFRYMVIGGGAIGFGILSHPGLILLVSGLGIAWLWIPTLRKLMHGQSWLVLSASASLICAAYFLSGPVAWLSPLPAQSGLLARWGLWQILPFFSLIWLCFFYRFWRYPDSISLMVLLMAPVSFLSFISYEAMAAAIAPTYIAFVGYQHFWKGGATPVHFTSIVGQGAITAAAIAMMWNPLWDQPISNFLHNSIEEPLGFNDESGETFLYQNYRARSLARLAKDQWQDEAYSGVATDSRELVPPLKFYGPSPAPLFWLGGDNTKAILAETKLLPLMADRPILVITDNADLLNDKRLANPRVLSRTIDAATKEKAEKTWIVFSAHLKVSAN